ncbi:hypothetical protein H4Q26_013776 [Puccinia striiformis f. sp. tritici PST-130]|uniref:Uncharacterized protein n=1 Tax=Puccinia striiformis f. sp. tritici PST-78 TaxID=1165861 RepID=A0A0L0V3S0_9BASI|nr:hypothetical protein H4Q26_013776 [Puccinia striiformis f. sp. tritici PST-130]KNE93614.1 hypothetical protein PSTG_12990 [Puccinia striiformis f. sp. tritici PST-78]
MLLSLSAPGESLILKCKPHCRWNSFNLRRAAIVSGLLVLCYFVLTFTSPSSTTFAGPVPPTTPSLPPGKTSFSNHALASSTKKKSKKAKNSTPSPSETIVSNKKGKSKAIQEDISHSEGSSSDSDSDESDEESTPPQSSPAKRGRPRRDAVKQAAKSMAKK